MLIRLDGAAQLRQMQQVVVSYLIKVFSLLVCVILKWVDFTNAIIPVIQGKSDASAGISSSSSNDDVMC